MQLMLYQLPTKNKQSVHSAMLYALAFMPLRLLLPEKEEWLQLIIGKYQKKLHFKGYIVLMEMHGTDMKQKKTGIMKW